MILSDSVWGAVIFSEYHDEPTSLPISVTVTYILTVVKREGEGEAGDRPLPIPAMISVMTSLQFVVYDSMRTALRCPPIKEKENATDGSGNAR